MIKRLVWFGSGAAVGVASSLYIRRKVRRTVTRYTPGRVGNDAVRIAREFGRDVRDAVGEGVDAMRAHEAFLRSDEDAFTTQDSL